MIAPIENIPKHFKGWDVFFDVATCKYWMRRKVNKDTSYICIGRFFDEKKAAMKIYKYCHDYNELSVDYFIE